MKLKDFDKDTPNSRLIDQALPDGHFGRYMTIRLVLNNVNLYESLYISIQIERY